MKVFVSHSSRNKRVAARLRDDLAGRGIKVWLDRDELQGGDPLLDELQDALSASSHLLLLWSGPASESRYVRAEWQAAYDLEKAIIPCLLDKTPLPLFLRRMKFCDMRSAYVNGWKQIVEALRADGNPAQARPAPRKERAPDKQAVVEKLYRGQERVLEALEKEGLKPAQRLQAKLDAVMKDALRRWRSDDVILNLGGYHLKNAYQLKYWNADGHPPDPMLEKAEQLFHAALGIEPDDPSAKNGLGNIYWLRGDLDAAEFFVRHAITRAHKRGVSYEAAEHDLKEIKREKARLAGRRQPH
jgi:hypothetical protein